MPEKHHIGTIEEFTEGALTPAVAGDTEVLIARVGDNLFAMDIICTHALAYLENGELEDHEVCCPLHAGRFDVRTGEPTHRPAKEPLATYPVHLVDKDVYVEV